MEISKRCPKCNKDYSRDQYWKSSLQKHLARKNPCDRRDGYVREKKKLQSEPTQTNEEVSTLFDLKKGIEYITFYEQGNGEWLVSFMTKNVARYL